MAEDNNNYLIEAMREFPEATSNYEALTSLENMYHKMAMAAENREQVDKISKVIAEIGKFKNDLPVQVFEHKMLEYMST